MDKDPFPPVATVNTATFDLRFFINHKRRMWEEIQVEVLKEIPPKFGDTISEVVDPLEEVKKKRFEEGNLMILWNLKERVYLQMENYTKGTSKNIFPIMWEMMER